MSKFNKIATKINPYLGYRFGRLILWGLNSYTRQSQQHILAEKGKGNERIRLSKEGRFFSNISIRNLPAIEICGLHPEDMSQRDLNLCIRFLSRERIKEGRTYSLGDLRIKIDKGLAWVWKTQAQAIRRNSIGHWLKSEGISEFSHYFSLDELVRLIIIEIDNSKSECEELKETYPKDAKIHLIEALENIRILPHVMKTMRTLELLCKIKDYGEKKVKAYLRTRGNPAEIDEKGISESISYFFKFNDIVDELKFYPRLYRVLLASLWLHDIGKLIADEYHFLLSGKILRTNDDIKKKLLSMFNEEELEWITFLAENHSIISDTAILKERDIFYVFERVVSAPGSKETKKKLLKALLIISICDVEAYNRMSDQRIRDMFDIYQKALKLIEEERPIDNLMDEEMNNIEWGKIRFRAWTIKEGSKTPEIEEREGKEELIRIYPDELVRNSFFEKLGEIELVGLIYDLRREIDNPKLRARLLVWLVSLMKKYKENGYTWCEFCITRFNRDVFAKEVRYLTDLLQSQALENIESFLRINFDEERKGLLIRIPIKKN